jgi:hypothetical protein
MLSSPGPLVLCCTTATCQPHPSQLFDHSIDRIVACYSGLQPVGTKVYCSGARTSSNAAGKRVEQELVFEKGIWVRSKN